MALTANQEKNLPSLIRLLFLHSASAAERCITTALAGLSPAARETLFNSISTALKGQFETSRDLEQARVDLFNP